MKKFSIALMAICALSLCMAEMASAQRGRGAGPGIPGRSSGWLGLLRMEAVQNEIELVDDQLEEIEALQNEMWEVMQEEMRAMRDLPPEERRERFATMRQDMEERQEEYQDKIKGVLLPDQISRLEQLQVQSQARRYGNGSLGLLKNKDFLRELGIDEDKQKELEEKAEEVKKDLDEKIKKLRAKAEEEVLSVLSSDQRKKFREKIGDSFDFTNARDPGFRRGRGEGRGRGERPDRD